MNEFKLTTPIAFIIFNRPNTTQKVFEIIRKAKPSKLFVIADGPRESCPGEAELCFDTRRIIESIDWDCEVIKNYSRVNLGCKKRVSSGIDWVFENVGEAIILEDDIIPHLSFFRYCQELLEKYREDNRIMMISGDNFQFGNKRSNYSYYYSRYCHIWGWATWRRAWKYFDVNMKVWPEIRDSNYLIDIFQNKKAVKHWKNNFSSMYNCEVDTWDSQWVFACLIQNGVSITPNVNLISNIGFGKDATHTKDINGLSNMNIEEIKFPLSHPNFMIVDKIADHYTEDNLFVPGIGKKINYKLKHLLHKFNLK